MLAEKGAGKGGAWEGKGTERQQKRIEGEGGGETRWMKGSTWPPEAWQAGAECLYLLCQTRPRVGAAAAYRPVPNHPTRMWTR